MYGLVDQVNCAFYQQIDPAGHRTWRKLYVGALSSVRNGWDFSWNNNLRIHEEDQKFRGWWKIRQPTH